MDKIEKVREYFREYDIDGFFINSFINKFYVGNLFSFLGYVFIMKEL